MPDDWLRGADVMFNLGSGYSTLDCDSIYSENSCPKAPGRCDAFKDSSCKSLFKTFPKHEKKPHGTNIQTLPPPVWYVRHVVSTIQAVFHNAHEALQSQTIRSLGKVDKMIDDFKADPPKPDKLKQILSQIGAGKSSICPGGPGRGGTRCPSRGSRYPEYLRNCMY